MLHELICLSPGTPFKLSVRTGNLRKVGPGQVLVRVEAASVNPIDVKRAGGYGKRLLGLKGAGDFPLVLGNDFSGTVEEIGDGVQRYSRGQRVFGLIPTGKLGGAHVSHVLADESNLMLAPNGSDTRMLATLPYSFTTMWLAVHSTGLRLDNAEFKRVLISGASGALGRLALQMISQWRAQITAICDTGQSKEVLALGANAAVERGTAEANGLPSVFDVVLNFGAWESDPLLISKLGKNALGYATTVHPLMGNIDRLGWLRGGINSIREFKKMKRAVKSRSSNADYSWTIFKPNRTALTALEKGVEQGIYTLPVGVAAPFEAAPIVFEHVAKGNPGRGILVAE